MSRRKGATHARLVGDQLPCPPAVAPQALQALVVEAIGQVRAFRIGDADVRVRAATLDGFARLCDETSEQRDRIAHGLAAESLQGPHVAEADPALALLLAKPATLALRRRPGMEHDVCLLDRAQDFAR